MEDFGATPLLAHPLMGIAWLCAILAMLGWFKVVARIRRWKGEGTPPGVWLWLEGAALFTGAAILFAFISHMLSAFG